jgi:hypothetical protein
MVNRTLIDIELVPRFYDSGAGRAARLRLDPHADTGALTPSADW